MYSVATRRERRASGSLLPGILLVCAMVLFTGAMATGTVYGKADNFTDIFYTNSFRGAFEWVQKLDWVGMIVQCVISTFSLFGVALLVIRIMTSMLFLSAKGMWEEVHDLKSSGESAEKDFLGMFGMAKTWASGKSGTGVDAIIGAVMLLLPDVKRYSDFGEKAGGDFSEDITISQYMLKIALPTVMTVFFFAMGFNGTLFQALAVTVDMMGAFADQAVSVNYAGIVDDLVNSNRGFKFVFDADGTSLGKMKQSIAKDLYGKLVGELGDAATPQILQTIGNEVQKHVESNVTYTNLSSAYGIDETVKNGLGESSGNQDAYVGYLKFSVVSVMSTSSDNGGTETSSTAPLTALSGVPALDKRSILTGEGVGLVTTSNVNQHLYICVEQDRTYNGNYFNNLGNKNNSNYEQVGGVQ